MSSVRHRSALSATASSRAAKRARRCFIRFATTRELEAAQVENRIPAHARPRRRPHGGRGVGARHDRVSTTMSTPFRDFKNKPIIRSLFSKLKQARDARWLHGWPHAQLRRKRKVGMKTFAHEITHESVPRAQQPRAANGFPTKLKAQNIPGISHDVGYIMKTNISPFLPPPRPPAEPPTKNSVAFLPTSGRGQADRKKRSLLSPPRHLPAKQ